MARPDKQGIDYHPLDIALDQDDKLGMIIAEYGFKGELLFIKLLGWIYSNGYYREWNEESQLKFLNRYHYCGFDMNFLDEVVNRMLKWGLFDRDIYSQYLLLTSRRIQSTWSDATRKRKNRKLNERIWLIDLPESFLPEEIPVIDGKNPSKRR